MILKIDGTKVADRAELTRAPPGRRAEEGRDRASRRQGSRPERQLGAARGRKEQALIVEPWSRSRVRVIGTTEDDARRSPLQLFSCERYRDEACSCLTMEVGPPRVRHA